MAIKVNLLPQDQIVSGSLGKFLKASRSINTIALSLFLIFTVGISALIFMQSRQVSSLNADNDKLKRDIAALEVSEQQMVLLKDRIKKIQTVQTLPNSLKNLEGVEVMIGSLPQSASVTDLEIDSKKVELSVNFKSNSDMSSFIENIKNTTLFKSVILSSFGLSPTTGYLVGLSISGI